MTSKIDSYVISINFNELASDTSESSDESSELLSSQEPNVALGSSIKATENDDM